MTVHLAVAAVALVATACGDTAAPTATRAPPPAPETSTATTTTRPDMTSTAPPTTTVVTTTASLSAPLPFSSPAVDWPDEGGDPPWETVETGLLRTAVLSFQGGYVAVGRPATAAVGHMAGTAWCYVDPTDCGGSVWTVLASGDGSEWRRLPLSSELAMPDHPVEVHSLLVDGKLAVIHAEGDDAVPSTLGTRF